MKRQRQTAHHEAPIIEKCLEPKKWLEKNGAAIGSLIGAGAVLAACWAFILKQANPHIDGRIDLKLVSVSEHLSDQDTKIAENTNTQNLIFEMLSQHISTGEMVRARQAYKFKYIDPNKAKE